MKKHLIYFIVDSVRNYVTGEDDRDKIDFMFEMGEKSCEFSKMISSAPSSIMSVSSTMTGIPAYFIGRNYEDFKYDNNVFVSLTDILTVGGYENYSVMNARETREKFSNLFNVVGKKYYPPGLSHTQKNWSNKEVNQVLERLLKEDFSKPTFFMIYYNVRLDPSTSDEVKRGYEMFKEKGLLNDSVFVLTSDHGYIDPKRGYTPEKLKEMGLSHDVVMSDDNIIVPFYITYPGCPVKKIETTVSTLDVLPTLLDVMGFSYPTEGSLIKPMGHSLVPYIEGSELPPERMSRSDSRFLFQDMRVSVIRGDRYKYVFSHDKGKEEFYDLVNDDFELDNLVGKLSEDQKEAFDQYKAEFLRLEKQAVDFQHQYMLEKLFKKIRKTYGGDGSINIALILLGNKDYRKLLYNGILRLFPDAAVVLIQSNDNQFIDADQVLQLPDEKEDIDKFFRTIDKSFDVGMLASERSSHPLLSSVKAGVKYMRCKRIIEFDVNMDDGGQSQKKPWYQPLRVFKKRYKIYLSEPSVLFDDMVRACKYGKTRFLSR